MEKQDPKILEEERQANIKKWHQQNIEFREKQHQEKLDYQEKLHQWQVQDKFVKQ